MLKQLQMGLRAFMLLASRVWTCLCFMIKKQTRAIIQHQSVKYDLFPLSPLSRHRLSIVKRKVLVLDLDETLIHSHHDGVVRQTVRPGTPPDFVLKVVIDRHPVRFFVHKRPHVDFFLDIVSSSNPRRNCNVLNENRRFRNGTSWWFLRPAWRSTAQP
jgi:CTD nuclear envelope phosphatase 1